MLESLHISIPGRFTATPPVQGSPSLRASSFKSSDGSIAPLRRSSSVSSLIPETDTSLDNSLKGDTFKIAIVKILIKLRLTNWKLSEAESLVVKNIASALTNSVYLIILDSQKLLLRIYGPNVLHLIDRDYETSVLARLAHHRIGPRLLGQFKNGRIEQWLESVEVGSNEIRDPIVSTYIARRLREFHDYVTLLPPEMDKVSAITNLEGWIPALPKTRLNSMVQTFIRHIKLYRSFVRGKEGEIVFCHNDLQYGNLLRTKGEEHNCLAVIDFEYAGPNPRSFDIANHFIEWMANYHESPSHELDTAAYPTYGQSRNFLGEYIQFGKLIARREDPVVSPDEIEKLSESVDLWRAMSHAQWAIWGLIQALPDLNRNEASSSDQDPPYSSSPGPSHKPRRPSKSAQSPMLGGMKSPFLPPTASPKIPAVKRTSSHKSPSYFPVTTVPTVPETDPFTLGEPVMSSYATDDILLDHEYDQVSAAAEWSDEDGEDGFDYTAYSNQRIGLFYGEVLRLGIIQEDEVPHGVVVKRLPDSAFTPVI
ncbi:Ethanolamine kinase [Taphrina deformans PYCC 5710]|uniref:Ethanolamine kinase n=1 Tax=Taphrina deformans (strain PYCC 5710 / ATCC 11124 / CBS 356.35 / IMI 108563 / JCM 9778 / NBRC 8474) TaxID=1097556 RepID=R4XB20_TAPDE|nr:Ethanolamine kinase [Taphrina deformans PYCC 5710]|eukprot:CCG80513.1 Ethanolamine kinase [Taphrina deformans PYCC 5710]